MIRTICALLMLGQFLIAGPATAQSIDVGMRAPSWSLTTDDGGEVSFPEDVRGKTSILLFWATWCPYCKAAMPYLDNIVRDYADHGVRVFAIDFKDDGDPVEMMADLGYDFTVLPLGDLVADDYGVFSAPGILVVNGEGIVVYRRRPTRAPPGKAIAEVWDEEIRVALDRVLGQAPEGT